MLYRCRGLVPVPSGWSGRNRKKNGSVSRSNDQAKATANNVVAETFKIQEQKQISKKKLPSDRGRSGDHTEPRARNAFCLASFCAVGKFMIWHPMKQRIQVPIQEKKKRGNPGKRKHAPALTQIQMSSREMKAASGCFGIVDLLFFVPPQQHPLSFGCFVFT